MALARLTRALSRGQLHHALLLTGPEGVGKATVALAVARALHCPASPRLGCRACNTCRRIDEGHHVGVEWLRPPPGARSIGVEAARDVRARVELAPLEGNAHAVIVDTSDALTTEAANALLKALEEPRPGVYFLLLADNLRSLLPTILSRCMPVRLGRLDDADVAAIVQDQVPDADRERLAVCVRLAGGSAGLARQLLADESLNPAMKLLQAALGAAGQGPAAIFSGKDSPLWTAWADATVGPPTGRPARERAAASRIIDLWLLHLGETVRGRPGLVDASLNLPLAARQMNVLHRARDSLGLNANVRLTLEQALLDLGP